MLQVILLEPEAFNPGELTNLHSSLSVQAALYIVLDPSDYVNTDRYIRAYSTHTEILIRLRRNTSFFHGSIHNLLKVKTDQRIKQSHESAPITFHLVHQCTYAFFGL
jgi:hypothetical protein